MERLVVVVDGVVSRVGGVEEVVAVGEIRLAVVEMSENGWHDIGLAGDGGDATGERAVGREENDGNLEVAGIGEVLLAREGVGVVGGDDEEGVVVPGLSSRVVEEETEGVVGVADALVERVSTLLNEGVRIASRNVEWVVGGDGEERRHERLAEGGEGVAIELEELLVPDAPVTVVVVIARVGVVVFGLAVVVLESADVGERLEAHGTVGSAVEEGGVVALVIQDIGDATDPVVAVGGEEIRLVESGYAAQNGRHGIDGLAPVGESVFERERVADEAVEERRVATVGAIVEVAVEFTDELLAERFENEDDDVLLVHGFGLHVPLLAERRIDGLEFLLVVKVVRVLVRVLADGAEEAERGVEHDGGFEGLGDILVGVAERDGADERSEAAAHAVDDEEDRRDKRNGIAKAVSEIGRLGRLVG